MAERIGGLHRPQRTGVPTSTAPLKLPGLPAQLRVSVRPNAEQF